MTNVVQIRFAPAVASMRDYLEPHLPWLEKVVGCKYAEALTFEIDVPIDESQSMNCWKAFLSMIKPKRHLASGVTGRILFPSPFEPIFRQSFQIPLGFRSGRVHVTD
jgi:hypothetical protein